jgi:hypothetical protein
MGSSEQSTSAMMTIARPSERLNDLSLRIAEENAATSYLDADRRGMPLRAAEENAAAGQRQAASGGTPLREAEETPRASPLLGYLPPQCGGNEEAPRPTGAKRAAER